MKTEELKKIFQTSELAQRVIEDSIEDLNSEATWGGADDHGPATQENIIEGCIDAISAAGEDISEENKKEILNLLNICRREEIEVPENLLELNNSKVVFSPEGPIVCDVTSRSADYGTDGYVTLLKTPYRQDIILFQYYGNEWVQFCQKDWESPVTEVPEDLSEIEWVRCRDARPAIMLDGLPRVLE